MNKETKIKWFKATKSSVIRKQEIIPDTISYTSYTGEKVKTPFELFDLDKIRQEVQAHITKHTARRKALEVLPDEDKFDYYYSKLFNAEKMICNWTGLNTAFEGHYPLNLTELDNWKDYKQILSDDVLLTTNGLIRPYDEGKITFKDFLDIQQNYLREQFPLEWVSSQERPKVTQPEVDDLFNKCMSNHTYKPTPQELDMFKAKGMPTCSTRWLTRKMKGGSSKFDIETYFNQFEITLVNNPQPTYKLCSPFNHQLSMNNIAAVVLSDEGEHIRTERVQNLEHRIHILIQDKIENMFMDWFRKKYVGDEIQIYTIDKQHYFHSSRTRTGLKV
jgi:hypothetical protein|tara:strand:- start:1636 stop:2631 length:996 start_codon:yes stop_codon:yes gene_type:complete